MKTASLKAEIVIFAYLQANDDRRVAEFAILTSPGMISGKNAKIQIGKFG